MCWKAGKGLYICSRFERDTAAMLKYLEAAFCKDLMRKRKTKNILKSIWRLKKKAFPLQPQNAKTFTEKNGKDDETLRKATNVRVKASRKI